jgi:Rieske Fe-S protein
MSDNSPKSGPRENDPPPADPAAQGTDRRSVLATSSTALMVCGLASGYGTFFAMAGRYFFPSGTNKAWMFVTDAQGIAPGASAEFVSPTGVQVTITRLVDDREAEPTAESFLALSSVCPHLGCRVHWEPHNDRFFCPCHNGVFDPAGKATSGPPAADGQDLPRYPLKVAEGGLYIEMPVESV